MSLLVFIYSCIQEMFSEHLLYARLGKNDKSERVPDNWST